MVVKYEGQRFADQVILIQSDGALVSLLTKRKKIRWRCPLKEKKLVYDWEVATQAKKDVPLNKSSFY